MVGVARGHQRADTLKPYSQKTSQSNHTRTTALSNSMTLSHAHGAAQDWQVMVKRSDRMWTTGEGNGKPLQYSCLGNPMNSMNSSSSTTNSSPTQHNWRKPRQQQRPRTTTAKMLLKALNNDQNGRRSLKSWGLRVY